MAEVAPATEPRTATSLRVEDLMFLDDLRALGIAWIDRLAGSCTSRTDVKRVWTLIRMWGPDLEDAKDILSLSGQLPRLEHDVEKTLSLVQLCENYPS